MIIALYGLSCTGKTATARQLSQTYGLKLRSCGQELKEAVDKIGLVWGQVPPHLYQQIDHETLEFVKSIGHRAPVIIEGRYLDVVLTGISCPLVLVEFRTSYEERFRRREKRFGTNVVCETLHEVDDADLRFRAEMYSGISPLSPHTILDNTNLTIEECVQRVTNVTLMAHLHD